MEASERESLTAAVTNGLLGPDGAFEGLRAAATNGLEGASFGESLCLGMDMTATASEADMRELS